MAAPLHSSLAAVVLCAATALGACAPSAHTGRAAVADGVRFDYALGPPVSAAAPHTYHLNLTIADATTGSRIEDANVAVGVSGPGYDGSDLINLKRDSGTYAGDIVMPKQGAYRLTFQVNRRPPAASAVGFFETRPPV